MTMERTALQQFQTALSSDQLTYETVNLAGKRIHLPNPNPQMGFYKYS